MDRQRPSNQRQRWTRLLVALTTGAVLAGCGGDVKPVSVDAVADVALDATTANKDGGLANNWAQGYTIDLEFHGGPADGKKLHLNRDLFGVNTAFSFGSTHYTHGEVGFAMTDTLQVDVEGVQSQVEIILNFGLVVGSSVNPVHTDKAGVYPFTCRPPMVRIFFKNFWFRSTCTGLTGKFDISDYANVEGGTMAGSFTGRIQAHFVDPSFPDDCDATHNAKTCNKPDWYADVTGVFGFTLPPKDGK